MSKRQKVSVALPPSTNLDPAPFVGCADFKSNSFVVIGAYFSTPVNDTGPRYRRAFQYTPNVVFLSQSNLNWADIGKAVLLFVDWTKNRKKYKSKIRKDDEQDDDEDDDEKDDHEQDDDDDEQDDEDDGEKDDEQDDDEKDDDIQQKLIKWIKEKLCDDPTSFISEFMDHTRTIYAQKETMPFSTIVETILMGKVLLDIQPVSCMQERFKLLRVASASPLLEFFQKDGPSKTDIVTFLAEHLPSSIVQIVQRYYQCVFVGFDSYVPANRADRKLELFELFSYKDLERLLNEQIIYCDAYVDQEYLCLHDRTSDWLGRDGELLDPSDLQALIKVVVRKQDLIRSYIKPFPLKRFHAIVMFGYGEIVCQFNEKHLGGQKMT